MKLNFSQGIARHQTDVSGNATFLQRSASGSGQFIDLVVSPDPTVLILQQRTATYVVEELKTVIQAWGPITTPATRYLYWDVNLLTGALTRGMTLLPPVYAGVAPVGALDQHWFDLTQNAMFVYTNQGWQERVRVFAGTVTSGSIIRPAPIGSQAGLVGSFDGGNILLDSFLNPLRQSNGTFVTTTTQLNVVNIGTVTARVEGLIGSVMAGEELPKYSCIQLRRGGLGLLARTDDITTRIAGLVVEDLFEGDVGNLITTGMYKSTDFSFTDAQIGRPLFSGTTGQLTTVPPVSGILQIVGYVYDTQSINIQIHQPTVLDNPFNTPAPPPAPPGLPVANFSGAPLTGVAPLTVNFTSSAAGAVSTDWDFLNSGFFDATGITASYTYATPGVYTVRQRVTNSFGSDDEIKVSYVNVSAPNPGADVNLGLQFGAPVQVKGGVPFSFQVIVSNAGLANATNVTRVITLRSNNNSQVVIPTTPPGATVTFAAPYTTITLPLISIASGSFAAITMQAQVDANVASVQLRGSSTCDEVDVTPEDNLSTLTIGVKP